jgi:hypothetical protein
MRIVLFNDEGKAIGSFDHALKADDRDPARAMVLLDLLEKILETGWRDCAAPKSSALPEGAAP